MLFPDVAAAVERLRQDVESPCDIIGVLRRRVSGQGGSTSTPGELQTSIADAAIPMAVYTPATEPVGTIVWVAGGGFVAHDLTSTDALARRLAAAAQATVVAVACSNAPEHPYPAAVLDVDSVMTWLVEHGTAHGLQPPFAIGGDGSGACLATVAALRHPGSFSAMTLLHPMLDPEGRFDSMRTESAGLSAEDVAHLWLSYSGGRHCFDDPDFAPLLSDRLWTLPSTCVVTAEHDPLRGEAEHAARLLAHAGVEVMAARHLGQMHGFVQHPDPFPAEVAYVIAGTGAFMHERLVRPRPTMS